MSDEAKKDAPQIPKANIDISGNVSGDNLVIGGSQSIGGDLNINKGSGTQNVLSGNFTNSNVNVDSTLEQVSQSTGAAPKEELDQLIANFQAKLDALSAKYNQQVGQVKEELALLTAELQRTQPNKQRAEITGESLKAAAKNLASVIPDVVGIATGIVGRVLGLIR